MDSWLTRTTAAISRLINASLFDGDDREMLSSRAYRESWKLEGVLDTMFWWQPDHCRQSFEWERDRAPRPTTSR